eukprot:gene3093-3869_t
MEKVVGNQLRYFSLRFNLNSDTISYNINFEEILGQGSIPINSDGLEQTLIIDHPFIRHNPLGLIPHTVTEMNIFRWRSMEGEINMVPASVKILRISSFLQLTEYDNFTVTPLPPLVFSPGCFPDSIVDFDINQMIDSKIQPGSFPNGIKSLSFSMKEQITPGVIPNSVKLLGIKQSLGQDIYPGIIPNGVESLSILSLKNLLPGSVPSTVKSLLIVQDIKSSNVLEFHDSLECLSINEPWTPQTKLPPLLTYLCCIFDTLKVGFLPKTLKSLILEREMKLIEINSIPESVYKIQFHKTVSISIIEGTLPKKLKELQFYNGVSSSVPFPVLPSKIKKLLIHVRKYPPEIPSGSLPDSIQELMIWGGGVKLLSTTLRFLPSNLKILDINYSVPSIIASDFIIPSSIPKMNTVIIDTLITLIH